MYPETVFVVLNALLIIGGVVLILASMMRRQRIAEMAHIERMAMIERGMTPPAESVVGVSAPYQGGAGARNPTRSRMLSGGIVVIGFGVALMTLIGIAGDSPEIAVGVGGALVFLGAAFVVIAMVQGRFPEAPRPGRPSYPPVPPPPVRRDGE